MSLDNSRPMKIQYALQDASSNYSDKTFNHAMRLAAIVAENQMIPDDLMDDCISLAIMHDLLEDTDYSQVGLPENFGRALDLLTKPDAVSYEDYCKNIKNRCDTNYGKCAYWVKLADIKDHLSLTDTLTDKLKEKYLNGLRYLL